MSIVRLSILELDELRAKRRASQWTSTRAHKGGKRRTIGCPAAVRSSDSGSIAPELLSRREFYWRPRENNF